MSRERLQNEIQVEATTTFNVLPKNFIGRLEGTTPSVLNVTVFKCNNGGATTVTNFIKGQEGQTIRILGDGNTTIANNSSIVTNTGANKLLANNKIYRFTLIDNVWIEDE